MQQLLRSIKRAGGENRELNLIRVDSAILWKRNDDYFIWKSLEKKGDPFPGTERLYAYHRRTRILYHL
jgi:hypothetical protein